MDVEMRFCGRRGACVSGANGQGEATRETETHDALLAEQARKDSTTILNRESVKVGGRADAEDGAGGELVEVVELEERGLVLLHAQLGISS